MDEPVTHHLRVPPDMTRPKCVACGRRLPVYKYRAGGPRGELWVGHKGLDGLPSKWGLHGDNAFCGTHCGYQYAHRMLYRELRKPVTP